MMLIGRTTMDAILNVKLNQGIYVGKLMGYQLVANVPTIAINVYKEIHQSVRRARRI
jgi:endonuclease III-like uncharacterized protein